MGASQHETAEPFRKNAHGAANAGLDGENALDAGLALDFVVRVISLTATVASVELVRITSDRKSSSCYVDRGRAITTSCMTRQWRTMFPADTTNCLSGVSIS
jgi:hypothetical protein